MIVPEKDDSTSDISSNSSWTVLDENDGSSHQIQSQDAKDVTEVAEVFERVEKIEAIESENENSEADANSTAEDSEDAHKTESGFLTLEEFVQQRELEHDYEFDGQVVEFKEMLKKSDSKTKQKRKKSKAGQIGTLSVIGTVLAVTGLSFLCLLVPSDNPSASAAANVKSKLPNFSEVENSVSYTCPVYQDENDTTLKIIDDSGFIREILNKNNRSHKNRYSKVTPIGPMRREEFLKKHVPVINDTKYDINKFGNFTTRHQQTMDIGKNNSNKCSISRKGKHMPLSETEIVNPNHLPTRSEIKPAAQNESKKSPLNFLPPLLGNELACYMCQDLILLKMLSSLRKRKTYAEVEKLVREKRKHLSKESIKKERKQLRLLKVNYNDSSTDLDYEKGAHKPTKTTLKLKKVVKTLQAEGGTKIEKKIFSSDKSKAKTKVSKTNNLKVDIDLRHVPAIQRPDNTRTFSAALLTARNSKSNKQEPHLEEQKQDDRKISKIKSIDSVHPLTNLDKKELRNSYENIKKMENEFESSLTGEGVTLDRKIESLRKIRKAREDFIESLKRNRDQFKKQTAQNATNRKIAALKQCKSIATGFYKVPDIDNQSVTSKLKELQKVNKPYNFPLCHNDECECECKSPKCEIEDAAAKNTKTKEIEQRTLDSAHRVFEAYNKWAAKSRKPNNSNTELPKTTQMTDVNLTAISKSDTGCLELQNKIELHNSNEVCSTKAKRKVNKETLEKGSAVAKKTAKNRKTELTESNVKHVLDSIIREAVRETKKNKKRKNPKSSVSETDVDHADDEMSFSDSSLSPLKNEDSNEAASSEKSKRPIKNTSEIVVSRCRRADSLYYWLFEGRGQDIINKDHARWLLKKYPSANAMKPISKQDPKKSYVQKVTKF